MRVGLIALMSALLVAAAPQDRKRPKQGKGPDVGKTAPDFKLKKLSTEKSDKDKEKKPEYVTLSSFRGKKPVVLVFGSYT